MKKNGLETASRSINAVSFSSARTTKRFPSPRCTSTIQIVRPLESIAETQPQLQPALLRLSAAICKRLSFPPSFVAFRVPSPAWRNWQTRWTQNPVAARPCGFEPLRRQSPLGVGRWALDVRCSKTLIKIGDTSRPSRQTTPKTTPSRTHARAR